MSFFRLHTDIGAVVAIRHGGLAVHFLCDVDEADAATDQELFSMLNYSTGGGHK